MTALRLNLGCGTKRLADYVNVDKYGEPDLKHDLEAFPWPWQDNTVGEILLNHVLEHLGHDPKIYLRIFQEMYRVCQRDARIQINVPHYRHDYFFDDPTHVRAITPLGLQLFSQRLNREWIARGAANSPLALYLGVDFELIKVGMRPSALWYQRHPGPDVDFPLLQRESALYNNLIEEMEMTLKVIK